MDEEAKPKILPPSLRHRKRYIAFEIISDKKVSYGDVVNSMWNAMLTFLGELKVAESKVWMIQNLFNEEKQRGIIKCDHGSVEYVRSAMALISIVGEEKVILKTEGVTGTIKSARVKYLE